MAFIDRFRITSSCSQGQGLNVALQGRLVRLDGENEISASFFDEVLGDLFLGQERIRRDDLSRATSSNKGRTQVISLVLVPTFLR